MHAHRMAGNRFRKALSSCTVMIVIGVTGAAHAGSAWVSQKNQYYVGVKSYKEQRFDGVVRQRYDFSCGSAALATLLTYHYEDPVPETVILTDMYNAGSADPVRKQKITKEGFSLLDMKQYLEKRQYEADGFRLPYDKMAELGVPAIALITTNGYKHFVVIKGIAKDQLLLGDPALGKRVMTRSEFEKVWNGIVLLVRNQLTVAREHFNLAPEWRVTPVPPVGDALSRDSVAAFLVRLPNFQDF